MHTHPPLNDDELKAWFAQYGPGPLNEASDVEWDGLMNRIRRRSIRRRPRIFVMAGTLLLVLLIALPWAIHPTNPGVRRSPLTAQPIPHLPYASTLAAPPATSATWVDQTAISSMRPLAFISHGSLWVTSQNGTPIFIAHNASTPRWSSNRGFLAFIVSIPLQPGQIGAHPVLKIWSATTHQVVVSVPHTYQYAWRPGHDQVAAIANQELETIDVRPPGSTTRVLSTTKNWTDLLWSSAGSTLYASERVGTVQSFGLLHAFSGAPHATSSSVLLHLKQSGIQFAGLVPQQHTLLYWPDQQFSASLMADGSVLTALNLKTHKQTTLHVSLAHKGYLSLVPNEWAYMSGGGRNISGSKGVTLVNAHLQERTITAPKGQELIEPSVNANTGSVAMVVAQNLPNQTLNGKALLRWQKTRTLVVWSHGVFTPWLGAGAGVTDPHWGIGGHGILFIRQGWLWDMANAHAHPVRLVGPLSSTTYGYYGEIPWSHILAFASTR